MFASKAIKGRSDCGNAQAIGDSGHHPQQIPFFRKTTACSGIVLQSKMARKESSWQSQ
jgi:hypothetical protein